MAPEARELRWTAPSGVADRRLRRRRLTRCGKARRRRLPKARGVALLRASNTRPRGLPVHRALGTGTGTGTLLVARGLRRLVARVGAAALPVALEAALELGRRGRRVARRMAARHLRLRRQTLRLLMVGGPAGEAVVLFVGLLCLTSITF